MSLDFSENKGSDLQPRFSVCLVVILVFFVIVTLRLFYLQVVRGPYYRAFSAIHTMKEIRIPATRGVIFDRHHIPIAENRPSFDLAIVPQHVKDLTAVKKTLQKLAQVDPDLVDQKWKEGNRQPRFYPVVLVKDIPYEKAVQIRTMQSVDSLPVASLHFAERLDDSDPLDLRGVEVIVQPLRSYPQGPIAATTLGYINEISEKDLIRSQKEKGSRYVSGDLVGAFGLEKYWEKFLKGQDGYDQKVVDAVGREIVNEDVAEFLGREEARHGNNLVLTIDSRLQKIAEEKFQGKSGSLVALDPRNGEVLVLVSLPSYDPEKLVSNVSDSFWSELVSDSRHLLLNRAIQGTYPPGSTYKIVTAIAALEEGVIKENDTIPCAGGMQFGGRFFKCWRHGGHGAISVHRAIAESCDTFFYQVGLRLGVDRIAKYAHRLGLGSKTGIDLDGEKNGTIPTREWKKRFFKEEWQPGENLSIAVGQGYDTETPLQNALMVARVALGKAIKPHLLMSIEDEEEKILKQPDVKAPELLPISQKTFEIVRAGMLDTVESPGGTAHGSRSQFFKMAGKTGTAQVISEEGKARARGINTGDHAWFVVYAPYEDPHIAVAVIVEHGGFGASAAAPIAKAVIEKYMQLK